MTDLAKVLGSTCRAEIIKYTTDEYLKNLTAGDKPVQVDPLEIKSNLLKRTNALLEAANADLPSKHKLPLVRNLTPAQIADILIKLHNVVAIAGSMTQSSRYDLLAAYCNSGINLGVYNPDETHLNKLALLYDYELTANGFAEVRNSLRVNAPRKLRCDNPDLIPVANGVFNYRTRELLPHSPEYVFLSKSQVNFNPHASNPVIINPKDSSTWDVESWVAELSDDPQVVNSLWEILGASIRPHVRWNKSAWFYSETGNNGKGTFCELVRNLVGRNRSVSIPLSDFGKDFMLEPLLYASVIVTDENDVGVFLDKVANLKTIITNDVLSVNRKGLTPISYQFMGFMIQCLNELPQVRDRSESFYRRQLFIPFTKNFQGIEKNYIKTDYLNRTDVLEYVMKKVLLDLPEYYELTAPQVSAELQADYKEANDPVREFWNEHKDLFVWDLLPFLFLYSAYKAWFAANNPSGWLLGRNKFIQQLLQVVKPHDGWVCQNKKQAIKTANRMTKPEPLIATYNLVDWANPNYTGKNKDLFCTPILAESYRGLVRV